MRPVGHVLAIDAGGSGVKCSVVSLADGHVAAMARAQYRVNHPGPGLAEFDPRAWWDAILGCAAAAVRSATTGDVRAVVCTGMRIPFVLVDEDGVEIRPGILNHDRRGAELLGAIREAGGGVLYHRTGHWPAPEFGIGKLAWLARHDPEDLARASSVLQFHDWLVYRLSGAVASEPSSAAMSGALDLATGGWATDLLAALGLDSRLFPPLFRAGTPLGGVLDPVACVIGIAAGTPVLAGGGDTHMSCLGIGSVEPGDLTVVAGSTTPVMLAADRLLFDENEQPVVSPHVFPGCWALETNAGATGIRYTWLLALAREAGGDGFGYDDLSRLAATSPAGARGLFAVAGDPGWGEAAWASAPPGAMVGLTPSHGLGDVARAILEGSTSAAAAQIDRLERVLGKPVASVRLTGGSSRSAFWCQLLADISGREVGAVQVEEPSARAAALVALGDPNALPPPPVLSYVPEAGASAVLAAARSRYEERFEALREVAW